MRRFAARGETRSLDDAARRGRRGDFVSLSDGVTHYQLAGPEGGLLVVLVPGLTVPLGYWDDAAAVLHDHGVRTLAYSAYGRGLSDRVAGPYGPTLFVRQLEELLQAVDARDIHLVGTSMGALIALRFARGRQAPILSLTLCGPAGFAPTERNPVQRLPEPLAVLAGKYLLRRNLLSHLQRNVSSPADAARLRSLVLEGFAFRGSAYALLSTLRHFPLSGQQPLFDATTADLPPTLLLWGTKDHVTPVGDFDNAANLVRPVTGAKIDGCGHMVAFERPGVFADHLLTFLTEYNQ